MKTLFYTYVFSKSFFSKKMVILTFGILLFTMIFTPNQIVAQEEKSLDFNVSLNSDIFFGYYPFFSGTYKASEKLDYTFYGILWSGGTGAGWGNWTEFGVGVGFEATEGLYINPQIGLLNGSLTSGLGTPRLAEGLVPNLTIGLDKGSWEGELYAGYYLGFDVGNVHTNNYLHYWLNTGYKVTSIFSLGLHLEHLRFTGGKGYADDAAYDYFVAVGPYIQFSQPNGGAYAKFTSGLDLRSDKMITKSAWQQPSFFKLSVGYSF